MMGKRIKLGQQRAELIDPSCLTYSNKLVHSATYYHTLKEASKHVNQIDVHVLMKCDGQ